MSFRNADNKLSLAASNIWWARFPEFPDMPDYSGDCGDMIAQGNRRNLLRIVSEAGYTNPGEYNKELRRRMLGREEFNGPMSIRVYDLLCSLEIEDVCEDCGEAFTVTRNAHLAMYVCPGCGKRDC